MKQVLKKTGPKRGRTNLHGCLKDDCMRKTLTLYQVTSANLKFIFCLNLVAFAVWHFLELLQSFFLNQQPPRPVSSGRFILSPTPLFRSLPVARMKQLMALPVMPVSPTVALNYRLAKRTGFHKVLIETSGKIGSYFHSALILIGERTIIQERKIIFAGNRDQAAKIFTVNTLIALNWILNCRK